VVGWAAQVAPGRWSALPVVPVGPTAVLVGPDGRRRWPPPPVGHRVYFVEATPTKLRPVSEIGWKSTSDWSSQAVGALRWNSG